MHVELKNVSKRFGSVLANQAVSLKVQPGEVLALLGENGAGKSTLMKVLFGLYPPEEGEILIDGKPVQFQSPRDAMAMGIGMVFQQFNLIQPMSVLENLLLAFPKTDLVLRKNASAAKFVLDRLRQFAPEIDPYAMVSSLSVGQKQLIELAKVLNLDAQLVILDEPTSVLPPQEQERLWHRINQLAQAGHSVVLITHKMDDVMACADRVVVMRGGKITFEAAKQACSKEQLVAMMMGEGREGEKLQIAPPLEVTKVWLKGLSARHLNQSISDFNLQIKRGEIVGIAGVSGNGQTLLADCITGLVQLDQGEVIVEGELVQVHDVPARASSQIAYIPEQPAVNGIAGELSLTLNVALGQFRWLGWFPKWRAQRLRTDRLIRQFDVRPPDPDKPAKLLSGGNIQKLVVARELDQGANFVIACYPSMGLDTGATHRIYKALFEQAERGAAVLWISEDLDDLMHYAHRIGVMHAGKLVGLVDRAEADRYQLGSWMTSGEAA